MYSLLKILFFVLFFSGIFLIFWNNSFIIIFHTSLGFFFLVFFLLYITQHLKKYKEAFLWHSIKKKSAISGIVYLFVVVINILSGLMIFFYSLEYLFFWTPLHLYSGLIIFVASGFHLITRQKKRNLLLLFYYIKKNLFG